MHAHSCASAYTHVHTSLHMCAHMRTTDAHLQQPTQNRTSHPKASTASPNLATFSCASTCLTSLPLPSPIRGESPFEASHPVASPGRINFQLTTGGWPGVSAWPEPRQTGCGTRADDHTQGLGRNTTDDHLHCSWVSQPPWRSPRLPGPAIQKFMP